MLTVSLIAAVTCAAAFPVVRVLRRADCLDVPTSRSSHAAPTPRGGGVAILSAVVIFSATAAFAPLNWSPSVWAAVAGVVALALLGLADDVSQLAAHPRLLAQIGIGASVGAAMGGVLGALLGAIVVPAAVNMVNFMDGINGLCAGHAAVWGVGALAAAAAGGGRVLPVLGAISLGGGLGFLPWNAPRARLFLGDVGSYLIGGLAGIGVLAVAVEVGGANPSSAPWLLFGLVCAPYLLFALDTGSTIIRRARRRENLLEAHRDHVYQRLVHGGGVPHWAVSLLMASLSMVVTVAFLSGWALGLAAAALAGGAYLVSPRLMTQEVTA